MCVCDEFAILATASRVMLMRPLGCPPCALRSMLRLVLPPTFLCACLFPTCVRDRSDGQQSMPLPHQRWYVGGKDCWPAEPSLTKDSEQGRGFKCQDKRTTCSGVQRWLLCPWTGSPALGQTAVALGQQSLPLSFQRLYGNGKAIRAVSGDVRSRRFGRTPPPPHCALYPPLQLSLPMHTRCWSIKTPYLGAPTSSYMWTSPDQALEPGGEFCGLARAH
eukprot:361791-Chlamydomonas_euryale.AAC.10